MKKKLMGLFKDETGQAMTEYGLILALVAVVVIAALMLMGPQLTAIFTSIATKLTPAS